MLDAYWIGESNRQSPEADIPIVDKKSVENRLGGAANVASNLIALDLEPILISIVGDDKNGELLISMCQSQFQHTDIHKLENHITTTKTRIVDSNFKQWLRVDNEKYADIDKTILNKVIKSLNTVISNLQVEAIIIQDYNKGLIVSKLIDKVHEISKINHIPVFTDPKKDNFLKLSECVVFKPNLKELEIALGRAIKVDGYSLHSAVIELGLRSQYIFVTLADKGIYYFDRNSDAKGIIPGSKIENPDVSGAGDTVLSTLVWSYLNGSKPLQMAETANRAGYVVCLKKGVNTVGKDELMD